MKTDNKDIKMFNSEPLILSSFFKSLLTVLIVILCALVVWITFFDGFVIISYWIGKVFSNSSGVYP